MYKKTGIKILQIRKLELGIGLLISSQYSEFILFIK